MHKKRYNNTRKNETNNTVASHAVLGFPFL